MRSVDRRRRSEVDPPLHIGFSVHFHFHELQVPSSSHARVIMFDCNRFELEVMDEWISQCEEESRRTRPTSVSLNRNTSLLPFSNGSFPLSGVSSRRRAILFFSPLSVMKTLASVPADATFPFWTVMVYGVPEKRVQTSLQGTTVYATRHLLLLASAAATTESGNEKTSGDKEHCDGIATNLRCILPVVSY